MKTYLLILFAILVSSCDKQENSTTNDMYQGKIVGYLKCSDIETDNTLLGIFIITNMEDSLLSFNIASTNYNLDTNDLDDGINFLDGDSVQFTYKNANSEEKKVFDCPPSTMLNPTFYPIENFTQVIITAIKKIQQQRNSGDNDTVFVGKWELISLSGGFAPDESFYNEKVVWEFNPTDSVRITIDKVLSDKSRLPFKEDTILSYSYDSLNISIGDYKYEYKFEDKSLKLIDNLASDGIMLEFEEIR